MSALTIRAYNVLFGDAILVTVPDRDPATGDETARHLLIDVGNVLQGAGGDDTVFVPVVEDIRERLGRRPLDLYVMTHEHLDHVQGLPYAAAEGVELDVDHAWLTASSEPGYYQRHPEARRKKLALDAAYLAIERRLAADPAADTPWMKALMLNNDPRRTGDCVDYLRSLGRKTHYVHRETRLRRGAHHPFREAKLTLLAPEEDTAAYYGRLGPLPPAPPAAEDPQDDHAAPGQPVPQLAPPPGVDPEAFHRLVESWTEGLGAAVLAIDRAANDSSIVFELAWRGWRLLFAGDAEQKSWSLMAAAGLLRPVHFLKVGHHGSHNATPPDAILESILPLTRPDERRREALVSTCGGSYGGVPHAPTLERLEERCDRVLSTESVDPGDSISIELG
jgi:beta-lactamase superfamily II metal-dependent hydrolase